MNVQISQIERQTLEKTFKVIILIKSKRIYIVFLLEATKMFGFTVYLQLVMQSKRNLKKLKLLFLKL